MVAVEGLLSQGDGVSGFRFPVSGFRFPVSGFRNPLERGAF